MFYFVFCGKWKASVKKGKEGRLSEERRKRRALRLRCTGKEREGGKKYKMGGRHIAATEKPPRKKNCQKMGPG